MELGTAIRHALDGNAILFLGAGFSIGGTNKINETLPNASKLSFQMCDELSIERSDDLTLISERFIDDPTVGKGVDVLSLLFKLDEQVDMRFEAEKDENGEFIPSTVKLSFQNAAINQKLCTYLKAKQIKENLENSKEKLSAKDDYTEAISEIEQDIEDIKNHLVDDNMVVKKGTDGITVKLFPQ